MMDGVYELAFDPIRWLPSRAYIEVVIGVKGVQELEAIILKEIGIARARSDMTGEKIVYEQQKRTQWTEAERAQVAFTLATYFKTASKIPNGQKEKAAVIAAHPAFAEMLNRFGPVEWNAFRTAAKNVK